MKYKIGTVLIDAQLLADDVGECDEVVDSKFWIKRIQRARANAYRCLDLYDNINAGDSHSILKKELAAIGVEMIED